MKDKHHIISLITGASLVAQKLLAMLETQVQSESGRFPGEGHGYPFQYSYLHNPMDRGAWGTMVHGVTNSQT